jgi:hypothetical protein
VTAPDEGRASRLAAIGTNLAGIGAALTAAAATLCCVGPAVVAIVGVGGAVAAAGLKPWTMRARPSGVNRASGLSLKLC